MNKNRNPKGYTTELKRKRRAEAVKLFGGCCAVCTRITDDLQFHHIDPSTKEWKIGDVWLRTALIRETELAKCELLCGACHKNKHAGEILHGTPQGYGRGCKCEQCRKAEYEYRLANRNKAAVNIPSDKHGTTTCYDSYKCRCNLCRAAHAERARNQRKKKRSNKALVS